MEKDTAPAARLIHVQPSSGVAGAAPALAGGGQTGAKARTDGGDDGGADSEAQPTWLEAVARAERLLADERANGTSFSPVYCGGSTVQSLPLRARHVGGWPLKLLQDLLGLRQQRLRSIG